MKNVLRLRHIIELIIVKKYELIRETEDNFIFRNKYLRN